MSNNENQIDVYCATSYLADPIVQDRFSDNEDKDQNALKSAFDKLKSREKDILSYYISKGSNGLLSYSELFKEEFEDVVEEKDRVLCKMILIMESSYEESL